jgi:response regulator RpfG family c-di-GMP phosphodiesterase
MSSAMLPQQREKNKGVILVVDDEFSIREILSDVLSNEGFTIYTAENGIEALKIIQESTPDLVITDMKMPKMGGMELLYQINSMRNRVITIMMTGFATVETAVEAIKKGAYDYIMKPFQFSDLLRVIEHALEKKHLIKENLELRETVALYDISKAISSHLDMEIVLSMLLSTLLKEGDADAVSMYMKDMILKISIMSKTVAKEPRFEDAAAGLISPSDILAKIVDGDSLLLSGGEAGEVFPSAASNSSLESLLVLPIRIKAETAGFVSLFSFTRGYRFTEGQRKSLSILVGNVSVAVENARLYQDIVSILDDTVKSFARTLDAKDKYASGHSERVTRYALIIARSLKLDVKDIDRLAQAGLLHDIGKIGVSERLLNKKEKLELDEYEETKLHPVIGRDILSTIEEFRDISEIVYHHHEWFNGNGYPDGISGDAIPLLSRIIAVADAFDAMTSSRSYREQIGKERALEELRRNAGTQFDPTIVEALLADTQQLDIEEAP